MECPTIDRSNAGLVWWRKHELLHVFSGSVSEMADAGGRPEEGRTGDSLLSYVCSSGYGLVAEYLLPKQRTRVRFPVPAQINIFTSANEKENDYL